MIKREYITFREAVQMNPVAAMQDAIDMPEAYKIICAERNRDALKFYANTGYVSLRRRNLYRIPPDAARAIDGDLKLTYEYAFRPLLIRYTLTGGMAGKVDPYEMKDTANISRRYIPKHRS